MKRLTIKSIRDLRALGLRGMMVVLVIACQSALFAGGLCARITLRRSVDNFCDTYHLADLQVTFGVTSTKRLPPLDDLKGVKKTAARLMVPGAIHLGDGSVLPAAVIFVRAGENPAINSLAVEEGVFPGKDNPGVVIERGLRSRGYRVGNTITVSACGFTSILPVAGIARSPEFLVSTANPEMLIPTPGSLGIIFVPLECVTKEMHALSRFLGGTNRVNQLLFLYGAGSPPDDSKMGAGGAPATSVHAPQSRATREDQEKREREIASKIVTRLAGAGIRVESVLRRDEQFGITFLNQDLKMFRAVVLAIVGIFSFLTLIATGITVNRIVASQAREIGALMALGYRPVAIMMSYVRLGLLIGCAGGILGALLSPAINYILAGTYASAMDLPPLTLVFDPWILAGSVFMGIVVASAAAIVPILKLAGLTPVQVMRGGTCDAGTHDAVYARAAGALAGVLSGSLPQRAAARNLFRRPRLTAATILLLALGLGVTAGFVITLTSITDSSTSLLRRYGWDMVADFIEPQSCEEGRELSAQAGLVTADPFVKGYASVFVGQGSAADYQLVGVPLHSTLIPLRLDEGNGFSRADAGEIILNASFPDGPRPALGDTVTVTALGRAHKLRVTGLVSLLSSRQCFVPIETARRILGLTGKCSGFIAKLNGAESAEAEKLLYSSQDVRRVTVKSDLEHAINELCAKGTGLISLAVIIGSVVALTIVINTMSMNILEREGEFATLMSLGYGRLPLARMVLTEVLVMGVLALVIAVPVAVGIAQCMNAELSRFWFRIDTYVTLKDFMMTLLLPFLLLPLGALPALGHVFRLNIAQAVRQHVIE